MTSSAAPRISCEGDRDARRSARIFNLQRYSLNDGQMIRRKSLFQPPPHLPGAPTRVNVAEDPDPAPAEQNVWLHPLVCRTSLSVSLGAWSRSSRDVTLENLLQEVLKDEVFFQRLQRRCHLSGGRCSYRPGFARFLPAPAPVGIRTAIETAGDGA